LTAATSRLYSSSTQPGSTGDALQEELERIAQRSQTSVSLKATLDTGLGLLLPDADSDSGMTRRQRTLLQIATFLKRELPVRLARRVVELKALPEGLDQMPSVNRVREWYEHSFVELRSAPVPTTLQEEAEFAELLHRIYERHAPTLVTMARGVHELKQKLREERGPDYDLSDAAEIHGCAGPCSSALSNARGA
jgi:pyruvate dehydrogenase kinase 2/3/4